VLEKRGEVYEYEESLTAQLKNIEAREDYKSIVLNMEKKLEAAGGPDKAPLDLVAEAANALGMLAKNPQGGGLQFRREYSLVIRDILDGDGTGDRARAQNMNKDQYIEKFVKAPQFANLGELTVFLENEFNVRDFLISSMKETMARSRETVSAGANITLPQWKIDQVKLPAFRDKFEFFDHFEKRGSLEWQNLLKDRLAEKLNSYVNSSKFRLESDPTLLDRTKITSFLATVEQQLPEIVAWEVKINNKIIK
jgi:hypothetical protein